MTRVYNNATFQTFFEAFIASTPLIEWLKEVTSSMFNCVFLIYINYCSFVLLLKSTIVQTNLTDCLF